MYYTLDESLMSQLPCLLSAHEIIGVLADEICL